jgi:hypothetical protein
VAFVSRFDLKPKANIGEYACLMEQAKPGTAVATLGAVIALHKERTGTTPVACVLSLRGALPLADDLAMHPTFFARRFPMAVPLPAAPASMILNLMRCSRLELLGMTITVDE